MTISNSSVVLAALRVLALSAAVLAPALPQAALAQGAEVISTMSNQQRIKLGLNKSIVVDLPEDAYDILVANPSVADAVTRTTRRIYLFGKSVGQTNIFIFGADGRQVASLDLEVERDVAGLEANLARFIPGSAIRVELVNDNVVLTGTVDTPLDAKRAVDLATIFVSGGEATTGQYSQTAVGGGAVASGSGVGVGGGVDIDNPDSERRVSKIVNLIQIIGDDQVMLKVTVAEVSRNVMKQLGVNLIGSDSGDGISWGALSETAFGLGKPLSSSNVSFATSLLDGYINAMEQAGVMKTLAEPTLTAVSGEKATFKAGGEFNLVTNRELDDQGQITYEIQKIEYGIGLEFQPVVLSPGRISLKVRTSVSEPTNEGSTTLDGTIADDDSGFLRDTRDIRDFIPGYNRNRERGNALSGVNIVSIRKRLADTTIELPSGGSMMIAGLVRDDVRQVVNGLPGLSKLPVLGALFRSRAFERNETELVIIVTPYLARPTARNELAKPDDNFTPAGDGPGYFLGRVNRVYGTMKTDLPPGRYHGVVGFIYK
jgi:pilus assembly protein CpaC